MKIYGFEIIDPATWPSYFFNMNLLDYRVDLTIRIQAQTSCIKLKDTQLSNMALQSWHCNGSMSHVNHYRAL